MANVTDNGELMDIFYEEAQSLIDEMRGNLPTLSQGQEMRDEIACSSNEPFELSQATFLKQSAVLRRLFRCAHIIKSSSASVGLDELKEVAATLEKIFKKASDERFVVTADVISLLSESVEVCQRLLNEEEIVGHRKLLDRLNNILQPCRG
jgi:chemotaxis protein histidine kinase CheA